MLTVAGGGGVKTIADVNLDIIIIIKISPFTS